MRWEPGYLIGMAMQTLPEPRKIAREVLALDFPRAALWQAFVLFAVLRTGLAVAFSMLAEPAPQVQGTFLAQPLTLGIGESLFLLFAVFASYRVGRAFGGRGSFDQALLWVIWLQWLLFLVEFAVVLLMLVAPGLSFLLALLTVFLTFWVPSYFIAEMHGFTSVGLVFVVTLLTLFVAVIVFSFVLALLGVTPQSLGIPTNV